MAHKAERVQHLQKLLAEFGRTASLDREGVRDVDAWIHRYGGWLMVEKKKLETSRALVECFPAWEGQLRRINVIWDLAIYLGDMHCILDPKAHWELDFCLYAPKRERKNSTTYHKPCVLSRDFANIENYQDTASNIKDILKAKKYYWENPYAPHGINPNTKPDALERLLWPK